MCNKRCSQQFCRQMNRQDYQAIADERIADAEALLAGER